MYYLLTQATTLMLQSEQGKGSHFMVILPWRVIYDDLFPSSPDISPVIG
ncbi:hypothetical protein SAMN05444349_13918 [Bacteroides faecichinchillae]|uniref:Uncharacterized protein n=1 Tax=Bacteroides faecichinchillae TaxID=871325 RepID=A0A1M5EX77_9BACE|nr:hypothetical protein SAMN05444349_13918 [Bacteroides faecichinchillae]